MLINKDLVDRVQKITFDEYEEIYNEGSKYIYVSEYSVQCMIESLLIEIDTLQEKYDDLEQDLKDNYRPLPRSEYTGDSYDDRF